MLNYFPRALMLQVVKENGKNRSEAEASIAKGNETVKTPYSKHFLY